jgi:hypothetical protein
VAKKYAENSLGSLWSLMVWLTIFGLFFGKTFSWQYYTILISLTAVMVFKYFYGRKPTGTD